MLQFVFLHIGQAVYDSKKFTDVIGADRGLEVKQRRTRGHIYPLVLHHAGIATASGVHSDGILFRGWHIETFQALCHGQFSKHFGSSGRAGTKGLLC